MNRSDFYGCDIRSEGKIEKLELNQFEPSRYHQLEIIPTDPSTVDRDKFGLDYGLTEETRTWSDFYRTEFAPKSIYEFSDIRFTSEYTNSQQGSFSTGVELLQSSDHEEELMDRIRWLLEECDYLSGVQVFTEIEGLFGGMSDMVIQKFQDDFSDRVPFVTYTFSSSSRPAPLNHFNEAMSLSNLTQHSSLVLPFFTRHLQPDSFPGIKLKPQNWFQTSSLFASAIDTISMGFRDEISVRNPIGMSQLQSWFPKIAGVSLDIPFSTKLIASELFPEASRESQPFHRLSDVVPFFQSSRSALPHSQMGFVRGVSSEECVNQMRRLAASRSSEAKMKFDSIEEVFGYYLDVTGSQNTQMSFSDAPLYTPAPFPHTMFSEHFDVNGKWSENQFRNARLRSLPVLALCEAGENLRSTLETISHEFLTMNRSLYTDLICTYDMQSETSDGLETLMDSL